MGGDGRKIDINSADEETLQTIDGIDETRARLIVEYRESQGPFETWEQLELIDGIGETLARRVQAAAELGAGAEAEEEEDSVSIQADLDEEELIDTLTGLAELDSEAAAAYMVAAAALADDEMSEKMTSFGEDHRRHVRDLNRLIEESGGDAVEEQGAQGEGLLEHLAESAASIGPNGLMVAMIGNEMLTNGTYKTALDLPCSPEVRAVLERNRADEERHLRWLLEQRDRLGIEFPEEPIALA